MDDKQRDRAIEKTRRELRRIDAQLRNASGARRAGLLEARRLVLLRQAELAGVNSHAAI